MQRGLIDVLLDERAQLAHEDIRDELVGFSAAGVETASSCMAWTFKVLSVRPDLQESILQEVQGVLGSDKGIGTHHLPFSSGPRRCIGAQYAMALIKTVVASVVLAFCVDPAGDGHDSPAHFPVSFAISSWMTGGTRVVFRPRCAAKNGDQHG